MKKLFTLLAFCTFALCACETPNGTETPQPEQPAANLKLKLTSKSVMEFSALGGNGEITFEFVEEETRSAAPAEVTATTSADWITNFEVKSNSITFVVSKNNDPERSEFIYVNYGSQRVIVSVDQAGAEVPDTEFIATHLNGSYWGKFPNKKGFNYSIILGNKRSNHYLEKEYGTTEYRFNIYSEVSSAFNKVHSIPVGTYTIDHTSSGHPGTIDGDKDASYYLGPNDEDKPFGQATMVVTENSIVVDITFYDGKKHHVEYHGSLVYEDYVYDTYADVYPVSQHAKDINFDVKGGSINVYFRGDYYGTGCDVWFFDMIEQTGPYNGVYLVFDLIVPKSLGGYNNDDGFLGEFTFFDEKPESYEYTIPYGRLRDDCLQMHAWYLYCIQSQVDMSQAAPMTSGSVKVTKNDDYSYTFEVNSTDDIGNKIVGKFTGKPILWADQSCD